LVRWDDVNQPVQVYEQHQGHEEGRSTADLRKYCVLPIPKLHNKLAVIMQVRVDFLKRFWRTFPELESVAEVFEVQIVGATGKHWKTIQKARMCM